MNLVIRPPRAEYSPEECLPGPRFRIGGVAHCRRDLELEGAQGYRIQCSHYEPEIRGPDPLPCVIYLHGNSGSRCDATEAIRLLLPARITVFAVDLSGSGLSEGEYVTLGAREVLDVEAIVNHLRDQGRTSKIGIWGQSMGAVTALLYANRDPSIAGIVLDSPFSSLNKLMMELVDQFTAGSRVSVPQMATRMALSFMRSSIKSRAKFDINVLDVAKTVPTSFCPALFAHGTDDTFILPHHSEILHDAYAGDKNLIMIDGDHNSPRPAFFFDSTIIFFMNTLQPPGGAGAAGAVRELLASGNVNGHNMNHHRDHNHNYRHHHDNMGTLAASEEEEGMNVRQPRHNFLHGKEEDGSPTLPNRNTSKRSSGWNAYDRDNAEEDAAAAAAGRGQMGSGQISRGRASFDGGSRPARTFVGSVWSDRSRSSVNWSEISAGSASSGGRGGGGDGGRGGEGEDCGSEPDVELLIAMGFEAGAAAGALRRCEGDVEAAVSFLLGGLSSGGSGRDESASDEDEAGDGPPQPSSSSSSSQGGQGRGDDRPNKQSSSMSRFNPFGSLFTGFNKHYGQQAEYASTTGTGQGNTVPIKRKQQLQTGGVGLGESSRAGINSGSGGGDGGGGGRIIRPHTPSPTSKTTTVGSSSLGVVGVAAGVTGGEHRVAARGAVESGCDSVTDEQGTPPDALSGFDGGIRLGMSPLPQSNHGDGFQNEGFNRSWAPPLSSQIPRGADDYRRGGVTVNWTREQAGVSWGEEQRTDGGDVGKSTTGEMMNLMRDTSDADLARAISLSLQDCRIGGEGNTEEKG